MDALGTTATADTVLWAARQPKPANLARPVDEAEARKAAKEFEAVFVTQMLQHMFTDIETDGLFGGGHAEQMYRSMLLDEYGKMIANRGNGIGIADAVARSLLSHQEV